ncbi:MAG TPA: PstS family phosphate ABC transporter substrate-binding protein [Candidatus Cloacimonadota bacterium]|nr:PstS family phosphate ABC transporter substrate-binding protein [Candidatus Cloacimonadota bacterium]
MKRFTIILLSLILAASTIPALAQRARITCSGSTTVLPVAQATAEAFMNEHPNVNISVRGGGSGVGVAALQNGTVDIANSSRLMKSSEISQCRARGINPTRYAIANDGIAIVLHASNPVRNLTVAQIRSIYTGQITNWNAVGGPSLPIIVISRDVASGTFEVFNEKALRGARVVSSAQMLASNNAVVSTVADTPGAIGYAGLGYVTGGVHAISVNGIMVNEDNVKNGSYPLSRKLYMYTNGRASGMVDRYISFIQSARGQALVREAGFITLN